MPLLEEFASDFDRQVQARGREYFRRGAAAITGSAPGHFEATVQGSEPYRVRVDWDDDGGQPDYRCTCPYFQDRGQPCKHLWAALLKANREGLLAEDNQPQADDERPDAGLSDDEGLDDGDGADDDDIVVMSREPDAEVDPDPDPGAEPDPTVAVDDNTETTANLGAAKPGDAQWKRQLAKLREDMRAAAVAHEQPASAWPDNKRLVYVVDLPGTVEGTGLTIELAQETLKRDGRWDKARVTRVGREQTAGLPEQDRQIVQLLLGARRGDYGAGYYGFYPDGADSPRKFVLPESSYLTTFRQMVQTGRCRLRTTANDMVRFLEASLGLRESSLAAAMRATHETRADLQLPDLPMGLGWFVQVYRGERVVWCPDVSRFTTLRDGSQYGSDGRRLGGPASDGLTRVALRPHDPFTGRGNRT